MMHSSHNVVSDCPHCDVTGFAFAHPLYETELFRVICDVHPLCEGHILIIPKAHISCIGECYTDSFAEFRMLHDRVCAFMQATYSKLSMFEHGKLGQTVFHSHVHFLPFDGDPAAIVPEGASHMTTIDGVDQLPKIFQRDGRYLFFSIGDRSWTVDPSLVAPRFFRDRFAVALGNASRGNWKTMREDVQLMKAAARDIQQLKKCWVK